ncbi:MAG TPA: bifunctional 4-hydroxy-2-oxoglutarate aldolase/2-dehydro-3-deoxy-phosphogluconate aldolase [Acidisoma sp.]|uniref:bifunctional 4-hydroxy-2-oxoglutarate aldolase/2-dehydro-3-deoxy-phosphogluconate aldolase n=1 Tax=Acidisoma sp. TaxID=1872115 RepID=UPI002B974337|nr:bifunctional 4-hydroxy-2-oxoglutarate aldolase/2-dehydro-3-deoxy-phosphogluconate aldolase [Acidisoma sp.]HTI02983.1 bifunctional 4-hydroxy-2-oxoglutarate aldolase/2-dehydro-3-deoxy-phosphogluconate aldolase [Acidisoma sp.]
MSALFDRIGAIGVVPVIAIEDAAAALPLADALLEGGLPLAEITFRTRAAAEVMATLHERRPELLMGAGTILDEASLRAAKDCHAAFGLAPGYDAAIVAGAAAIGLPFAPGIMTPSELGAAIKQGATLCKFFPAGIAGGPKALSGIAAPFAHLTPRFIPTGGVTEGNLAEWLALTSVLAVGGTWIATTADIAGGRWADITAKARAAVAAVRAARGG